VSRGAVRDHLLGFKAVSGRGEAFVGGAKVVKNVTGYDLPKLAAGSWGRLFAMAEVTLKVLPTPEVVETLYLAGLKPAEAVAVMAAALGSQADVAAAAHLPGGGGFTLLRLEGFGPSVAARREMLKVVTADFGPLIPMTEDEAKACWVAFRDSGELLGEVLWRINLPPSASSAVIAALEMLDARWLMDWAGGLIWLTLDGNAGAVRAAAQAAGGHAMLVRAPEAMRREVPALHPQASGVMALEARVRRAFDPEGVFETGRFLDQTDAD
jgi:glycolate oxidase FAD binding subunit